MGSGLFITVEGTDGSGKSTQIALMAEYLRKMGHEVVLTREPGGTNISEKIRSIILDPENREMGYIAEALLYASSRAQHVAELIKPSVEQGKVVICDRFVDSSYVYQGFGRGIDMEILESVNKIAMDGMFPDITFFFDISPEVALERRIQATGADRIENEKMEFHMKVYQGYKSLAAKDPDRIKTIDADRSIEEIAEDVKLWLGRFL